MKFSKTFVAAILAGTVMLTTPAHAGIFSMMAASEASSANEKATETAKQVEEQRKEIEQIAKQLVEMQAILIEVQKALEAQKTEVK